MGTIVDKDATVALLRGEFAALGEVGRRLTADQWDLPTCLPGWTVRDNLSHVVGTESMLAGDPAPEAADGPSPDHVRNPIGAANEAWVAALRPLDGAEVLARFEAVAARRLAALDAMTQADFDAPSWTPAGKDETYGRFMRIRHFDCYLHEHDMREAVDLPPRPEAADLASCFDEVATGLGYIVGRRAALPAPTTVRLELTGPAARVYLVEVAGRARVVDRLEGPPTVGLTLPGSLFLRLAGGRRSAGPHLGREITLAGDTELAERLATNLAFTI